jgi:hypothetical protein
LYNCDERQGTAPPLCQIPELLNSGIGGIEIEGFCKRKKTPCASCAASLYLYVYVEEGFGKTSCASHTEGT